MQVPPRTRAFEEGVSNLGDDVVDFVAHFFIREPEHERSKFGERRVSRSVVIALMAMDAAVYLDYELARWRVEIRDVANDRMLTAKANTELITPKAGPETRFTWSRL